MKSDFLVDTRNPRALDQTLQQLGAVLIQEGYNSSGVPTYLQHEGHYVVRCLGSRGFVKFACMNQGYATVVADAPVPAPWDWPEAHDEQP